VSDKVFGKAKETNEQAKKFKNESQTEHQRRMRYASSIHLFDSRKMWGSERGKHLLRSFT
jgi:hypothetical protein